MLLLNLPVLAQKEGNIWYFGDHAGLDFNSGKPAAILNGQINTLEGCATISDHNGNLLFYTDGITVWNRNHKIMTNGTGLYGHSSSSHSGVIVPRPGSNNIYYVFTVTEVANPFGINYSEVDMGLSGGLGAVTAKNIQLITPALEKITAVRHASLNAIWVVMHTFDDNNFYSYLVTSSGINMNPVISSCGRAVTTPNFCRGCMKVSADGHKLAMAHSWMDMVELFDFDNVTGIVSNPVTFTGFNAKGPYGIEFSPSGKLLYVGEWYDGINIYQYNLTSADIPGSRITIGSDSGTNIGALQLAPDGKIYVAVEHQAFIGAINDPDLPGNACNFDLRAVYLQGKYSLLGLPTFIQSTFSEPYFFDLSIPNIFTPNNDGINDTFQPVVIRGVIELNTYIYNRWGSLVFHSRDLKIEWIGNSDDGKPLSAGSYFWVIEYADMYNNRNKISGTVTLFR